MVLKWDKLTMYTLYIKMEAYRQRTYFNVLQ